MMSDGEHGRAGEFSEQSRKKSRARLRMIWTRPVGRIRSRVCEALETRAYQSERMQRLSGGAGMCSR